MEHILNFVNHYSNAIIALATVAMFLATLAYVIINSMMHGEMVKSRNITTAPEINIRLEMVISGFYDIVIENTSNNAAYNIIFENSSDISRFDDGYITELGFFQNGIKYMAPGQNYRSFFLDYPKLHKKYEKEVPEIKFSLIYTDRNGKVFRSVMVFNVSYLYNTALLGDGVELHQHFRTLNKKIEELVEKLVSIIENKKIL